MDRLFNRLFLTLTGVAHLLWSIRIITDRTASLTSKTIVLACLVISFRMIVALVLGDHKLWIRFVLWIPCLVTAVVGIAWSGNDLFYYYWWFLLPGLLALLVFPYWWSWIMAAIPGAIAIITVYFRMSVSPSIAGIILQYFLVYYGICLLAAFGFTQWRKRQAEVTFLERARESTAFLAQANLRLQEYAEEVRELAKVEERNRLARDIHDTLGHTLTSMILQLGGTLELLEDNPQAAREHICAVREVAREGLHEIRASMKELRTQVVNRPCGRMLWERVAKAFADSTGVEIFVKITEEFIDIDPEINELVYRAIQEGLTNAVRHGHAEQVEITVRWEEGYLLVRVSDNGHGVVQMKKGFGLLGLQERLEAVHGKLYWRSAPEWGFDLGLEIPMMRRCEDGCESIGGR